MSLHFISVRSYLLVTLLGTLVASQVRAQTPFTHQGVDLLHPPDSALPNEQVDPASGTLTVVGTDLVLPGNAGFNLAVQRIYNSSVFPDYNTGSTAIEEDSWAGIGWKLHFGRVIHADSTTAGEMQIEMGDGSRHPLYHSLGNPNIWTTSDFWLYNPATHTLQLPNGRVYTFGREVVLNERLGVVRYVTEIADPFQNRITFTYFDASGPPDGIALIQQFLSATQVREIAFTYDPALKALASMTYLTHTWTYTQNASTPAGHSILRIVQPPAGPSTVYDYGGAGLYGELTAIHAPFGGTVAYAYQDAARRAGSLTTTTRVVATRTMSGHDVPTGTWTFAYSTGANLDTTEISSPCGGTTKYRFNGTGITSDFTGWRAGTLAELSVVDGSTTLESRTMTWVRSEAISNDPVSGLNGVWSDTAVYRPLLSQQTVTRNGHAWTTTFSYHTGLANINDYGHPYQIEETGETIYQWRRTSRTFRYGFTPHLLGVVASETVEQNSAYAQHDGTAESSWSHDLATGFLTSQGVLGVWTSFEPRADGNVHAVTDGRGNRTVFTYDWGRVSAIDSPALDTTSVVSPEGRVTSETQGDVTTGYGYDAALRLAAVYPPGGATPISYEPDNLHGAYVNVRRGSSLVTHDVDGFGREIRAFNSQGLKVEMGRDTCGRVVFTSDPFTTGPGTQGTRVEYDALGRMKKVTDSAGKITTYTRTGASLSRLDANGRTTTFDDMAFGDPGNGQLAIVTDANNVATTYRYHVTGALSRVSGPGTGLVRTWAIGSKGLPDSDTQPESGTTTYTYDPVGNLWTIRDASQQLTTFTYDANNRLASRDAPDTDDDLAITYDATGRVKTMASGGTTTTFTYNVAERKVTRSDVTSAGTFASIYASDADGNLEALTYPSGRIVTYGYDAENRLTSVTHQAAGAPSAVPFATGFSYGEDGRLASYVTGAVTHRFTYEFNRPKRVWTTGGTGALDLTYGYDNVGNVTSIADPRPNATQSFVPDPLDRLDSAAGPWGTLEWTYDAAGNRLSEKTPAETTYQYVSQRLMSTSGAVGETFTYDAVGRLTSDGRISQYTYSPTGKLRAATGTGVAATYTYDAAGERFSKTVNGRTTYAIRSLGGQTLSEYLDTCGATIWTRDLIYANGQMVGAAKATLTQPTVAMTVTSANVSEGAGSLSLNVSLVTPNGAALGCPVTVSYATSSGAAIEGSDLPHTTGLVTFAAGTASGATRAIAIPVTNDPANELNETFSVGLFGASGAAISIYSTVVVTIVDDDPPVLQFTTAASTASEGSGSATLTVTLTAGVPLAAAASVTYATANGTAVAGQDYTAVSGTVSFAAGSTNGAIRTIAVPILQGSMHEGNETLTVSLSAPSGATIGAPSAHTLTIADDDPTPDPVNVLEAPADGTISGSHVTISGYAIDRHAPSGTGITGVNVYAYPNADESQPAIFLGTATYGAWRTDVAGAYGTQFGPSGFSLAATLPGPGTYRVRAFAQDPLLGDFYQSNARTFTVGPTPRMNLDTPGTGTVAAHFTIGGWAIDAGAGSGTGVDAVQVYAYPNPGSGQPPIFLGTATYGGSRPDIGAAFGAQFTSSGYGLAVANTLAAGYYQLVVSAHSSVTATWSQAQSVYVTVMTGVMASIDAPAANATVGQPFGVTGWALDASAPSGNGVPVLHIYAYLYGATPQFLGAPTPVAGSRPDLGAYLQDSRFSNSGYGLTVTGLPAGTHLLVVYPYSSVSGFAPALTRWITVQ